MLYSQSRCVCVGGGRRRFYVASSAKSYLSQSHAGGWLAAEVSFPAHSWIWISHTHRVPPEYCVSSYSHTFSIQDWLQHVLSDLNSLTGLIHSFLLCLAIHSSLYSLIKHLLLSLTYSVTYWITLVILTLIRSSPLWFIEWLPSSHWSTVSQPLIHFIMTPIETPSHCQPATHSFSVSRLPFNHWVTNSVHHDSFSLTESLQPATH